MAQKANVTEGLLYHLIKKTRPELAKRIDKTGRIETIVVGLGGEGTKHAGIMHDFGTVIAAGIDPKVANNVIHEVIPVYKNIKDCMKEHPNIAVASIWRHYTSAKDSVIEVIEAEIPIVVLITEGMPIKDVKEVRKKAKEYGALLIGPNTPGVIFPPEGVKAGMLPDVFYPAEFENGKFSPEGITIISRSGAILYHLSDALASVGIAQNAVLGIGGDSVIGSDFRELLPLIMSYEKTDLIVIAGEIGGCKEELLAEYLKKNPAIRKKPIVALLSGANAPAGKTMGHAGAIISPGQEYGTFESKKKALESVGVKVVNSQRDLIDAVRELLKNKTYFKVDRYYEKMRNVWESPPPKPTWGTYITKIEPNNISIRGYKLQELIGKIDFISAAYLLLKGDLPEKKELTECSRIATKAAGLPCPNIEKSSSEELSKILERYLLCDRELLIFQGTEVERTMFCLGRFARYLGNILGNDKGINYKIAIEKPFSNLIYIFLTGKKEVNAAHAKILEAMIVASIDHGVTPPSTQAARIAASTRVAYEVSVAHGIGVITDVHGGAGTKAAEFFTKCVENSKREDISLDDAARTLLKKYLDEGKRVQGLGHRVHTQDPRRDVLYRIAEGCTVSGEAVALSKNIAEIFKQVKGINLPINVDGVIGAIVSDMKLDLSVAKALFIFGRVAGLSAHYFEEISTQDQMRRINFSEAVYKGPEERTLIKK